MSTRMVTGRAVGGGVWDVAGRTDVGRARANNQDQFLHLNGNAQFAITLRDAE